MSIKTKQAHFLTIKTKGNTMSGLLADVFSFGDTLKRKARGLLDDPMGTLSQYINNENDRAGRFNQLTAEAAQEGAQAIKSGQSMVGPKSQQLAGLLADAYNPTGMFIGASAKTWDKAAAEKAQQMLKAGADPKQVWKETGTFKGADGALRQEIDDSLADFPVVKKYRRSDLDASVLHEPLEAAYPSVKGIQVEFTPGGSLSGGEYRPNVQFHDIGPRESIVLRNSELSRQSNKSIGLHEIQHAIQQREGWAKGGSPESFPEVMPYDKLVKRNYNMQDVYVRAKMNGGVDPETGTSLQTAENAVNELTKQIKNWKSPDDLYRSLAGEAEARATQARMNMNPAQRREVYPFDSYDVPVDQLIIRDGLLGDAKSIVWHGSPHRFTKFDSSKIGTGEGAQAYGHGLYVAESPEVAGEYQKRLGASLSVDGKPLLENGRITGTTGNRELDGLLELYGGDMNQAIRDQLGILRDKRYRLSLPEAQSETVQKVNKAVLKDSQKLLADMRNVRNSAVSQNTGSLYKIDLPDEHIAKMLDWDKPLSQQSEGVRVAAMDLGLSPNATGKDIYNALANSARDGAIARGNNSATTLSASQAGASNDLREFGIPGIRYLDGGSRGTGQGTSNFVVFPGNEDMLRILEINGKPVNGLLSN